MSDIPALAHRLRPLLFRLYYVIRRQTPQLTLSLTQGAVLADLVAGGPARMSALAEAEGVRLSSMSDLVTRLERMGLIVRRCDPDDRRASIAEATDKGRAFHRELVEAREEFLRQRLAGMPEDDRAAISAALPALRRLVDPGAGQSDELDTPDTRAKERMRR